MDDSEKMDVESTEHLNHRLVRIEKENRSLEAYNSDLRDQVKLMNAKLNLAKNYLYQSVDTQTDIHIPHSEINGRVFTNCIMLPESAGDQSGKLKSELDSFLKDIKSSSNADYTYDAASKTYYSRSTGWYYYPESSAFYNPINRSYYRYDAKTAKYEFMYSLDEVEQKKTAILKKSTTTTASEDIETISSGTEEEGEIIELSDDDRPSPVHRSSKRPRDRRVAESTVIESKPFLRKDSIRDYQNDDVEPDRRRRHHHDSHEESGGGRVSRSTLIKIPPVRLIVKDADQLDIGSLVLVSCMSGKIGQHSNCAVIIPDATISQIHAEITYDHQRRLYMVQDLCSRNGTYQNDQKLKPLDRQPLFHGDMLTFGTSCRFLVHIHQHRDYTCEDCEPGPIANETTGIYSNGNTTTSVRSGLKNLKKKYGLDGEEYRTNPIGPCLPAGYRNRTAERQKVVGSDNPYEKTAAGSALDMPLNQSNKGFQMMEKMGWKTGQGLGTTETANTEPIDIEPRDARHGLGFGTH